MQSTAEFAGCPVCGTRAVGHGRTYSAVRDLPVAGRPVVLVFARRRWRCPDPDCGRNTWSEQVSEIPARSSLTRRARARIAEMVHGGGDTVADAACEFGVCWHTADTAAAAAADAVIAEEGRFEGVRAIGVDEKRFLNANRHHRTTFTTQIVDLEHHQLLDVLEGRSGDVLGDWLAARGPEWCSAVTLATLDPAAGYRAALDEHLPNATIVVDHFHVVRLANKAIDDIRRRTQWATTGHRGRKGDPLYRARRALLTGFERLNEERAAWMLDLLAAGDPDGEVGAAVLAKELLREVYAAVDEAHARRRLIVFFQHCADAEVPELARLARTVDRWHDHILAYHCTERASNGRVENIHMLAEKIRRNAHGFTNHTNYRRRLIARLGTKTATIPTRRIRDRHPRSVA